LAENSAIWQQCRRCEINPYVVISTADYTVHLSSLISPND
jgi:hypothetical protein